MQDYVLALFAPGDRHLAALRAVDSKATENSTCCLSSLRSVSWTLSSYPEPWNNWPVHLPPCSANRDQAGRLACALPDPCRPKGSKSRSTFQNELGRPWRRRLKAGHFERGGRIRTLGASAKRLPDVSEGSRSGIKGNFEPSMRAATALAIDILFTYSYLS